MFENEFILDSLQPTLDGEATGIGTCATGAIKITDEFAHASIVFYSKTEADGRPINFTAGPAANVRLEVVAIEMFGRSVREVPRGFSARLTLRGAHVQQVRELLATSGRRLVILAMSPGENIHPSIKQRPAGELSDAD